MSRLRPFGLMPTLDDYGFGLPPTAVGLKPPTVADQLPQLNAAEQGDILGNALETGLGGLAYLGKLIDKPGRAVRGGLNMLLGGDTPTSELASFLPFSDTVGLTQERNAVQGTDLNAQLGLTTKGDDSLENLGAGLLTEIATDPLTLLQLGPLTKAGKVLQRTGAGQLPKSFRAQLAGDLIPEHEILAKFPNSRPKDLIGTGKPLDLTHTTTTTLPTGATTSVTTGNVYRNAPGVGMLTDDAYAKAFGQGTDLTGQPLASLFGLGVPGFDPFVTWGTGETAQKFAGLLDATKAAAAATSPVRAVRAAFDPTVGGAYVRGAQEVAQNTMRPEVAALKREAATEYTRLQQQVQPFLSGDVPVPFSQAGRDGAVADVLRQAAEYNPRQAGPFEAGFIPDPTHPVTGMNLKDKAYQDAIAAGFQPQEAMALVRHGEDLGETARRFQQLEADMGIGTGELTDAFTDYLTRTKNVVPGKAGGGFVSGLKKMFTDFSTSHGSQIVRDEMFKDVPGGTVEINKWAKDPALRQMNDAQREGYFRQQLTGMASPSAVPEVNERAAKLAKWVGGLPEEHVTQGIDFFRTDPLADFYLRGQRSAQARGSTEAVFDGIGRFARPAADFVNEGVNHTPVEEILRKLNLDQSRSLMGQTPARNVIADRLGASPAGMSLPTDLANDLVKLGQAWSVAPELSPLMTGWNSLTNMFKAYVTTPFAAFHTRNLMSGAFNAWRDDAFSLKAWNNAKNFLRGQDFDLSHIPMFAGMNRQQQAEELTRQLVAGNVALVKGSGRAGEVADASLGGLIARAPTQTPTGNTIAGDLGRLMVDAVPGDVGKTLRTEGRLPTRSEFAAGADPRNIQGWGDRTDEMSLVREMRKVQSGIDDWIGVSHYIGKLEQGFDPAAAAMAVKKYQNDYLDLTSTERNVMKAVMPWYSFSRRSLPPLLEDMVTKPGKVAGALRAVSGVREPFEFVPGFVAEGASVPIPGAPDGQQRYISSFGLPFEDEAVKSLGSALHGDVGRTVQSVLGMTVPQVKSLIEMGTGQQLFSGRKLEDLRPAEYLTAAGLFDEETNRKLTQVISNTPLSRTASSIDRLFMDPRKGTGASVVNALTGIRVQDVDQERQRAVAARDALAELLRGESGVRASSSLYVPAANLPLLDPETARIYAAYRATQNDIQKRAKAAAGR